MTDNKFPTSPLASPIQTRAGSSQQNLTPEGEHLALSLERAKEPPAHSAGETIHVPDVGGRLTFAYETLRNAAEYSEEHLLMRRAIERYLRRNTNWRGDLAPELGRDLVTELTQARYLPNDTISVRTGRQIFEVVQKWQQIFGQAQSTNEVRQGQVSEWIEQLASVEVERLLIDERLADIFTDFAYGHYLRAIDQNQFGDYEERTYQLSLYLAVHRALIKSDIATARFYAIALQGQDPIKDFVSRNKLVDELFQFALTNQLTRLIHRNGAPMRVLREIVRNHPNVSEILRSKRRLQSQVEAVSQEQYQQTRKRLNNGIIRSVAFIFLTKMLVGLGIEIPYDLIATGSIAVLPLVLNLVFPPLYMATLGLGIRRPNQHNTGVILDYIERIMYPTDRPVEYKLKRSVGSSQTLAVFNVLYGLTFILSFGVMIWVLKALQFNMVHGAIFFLFLSAVSFFGFRLTQSSKEYVMVAQKEGGASIATDFFMTPFIRAGQWLSDKYSRLNIVTLVLDIAIEMPLKTSLRILRQWMSFLRDKREEL